MKTVSKANPETGEITQKQALGFVMEICHHQLARFLAALYLLQSLPKTKWPLMLMSCLSGLRQFSLEKMY